MLTKLARDGVNMLIDGLEAAYNVSPVIVKWKAANVDWFNRSLGSAKMALFVKTCLGQTKVHLPWADSYDPNGCKGIDHDPYEEPCPAFDYLFSIGSVGLGFLDVFFLLLLSQEMCFIIRYRR